MRSEGAYIELNGCYVASMGSEDGLPAFGYARRRLLARAFRPWHARRRLGSAQWRFSGLAGLSVRSEAFHALAGASPMLVSNRIRLEGQLVEIIVRTVRGLPFGLLECRIDISRGRTHNRFASARNGKPPTRGIDVTEIATTIRMAALVLTAPGTGSPTGQPGVVVTLRAFCVLQVGHFRTIIYRSSKFGTPSQVSPMYSLSRATSNTLWPQSRHRTNAAGPPLEVRPHRITAFERGTGKQSRVNNGEA
jgi:hypothetical protein